MAATIKAIPGAAGATPADHAEPTYFSLNAGSGRTALVSLLAITALAVAAYWEVLELASKEWSQPQYSHGWIIPLIALLILMFRRPRPKLLTQEQLGTADLLRKVALGLGAAVAVGQSMNNDLIMGAGLAGACLAWLGSLLIGQPYGEVTTAEQDTNYTPMWSVLGIGGGLVIVGLLAFFNLRIVPGLHPGYVQYLGLAILLLGGICVALLSDLGYRAGWQEMVFSTSIVALSVASWCYAIPVDMMPLANFSFLTLLFGLFGMVGGLRLLSWAGPAIAFLFFMFRLPTIIEGPFLGFLQKVALRGSEVVYTVLGTGVARRGTTLEVAGVPMEIVEACSGLSMTTILVAMAIAMVLIIKRPWWDKLIILISAFPIAVISNVFRIVSTGYLWVFMDRFLSISDESMHSVQKITHDWAGFILMMPFAMGLYWLELKMLSMLFVEERGLEHQRPLGGPGGPGNAGHGAPLPR